MRGSINLDLNNLICTGLTVDRASVALYWIAYDDDYY